MSEKYSNNAIGHVQNVGGITSSDTSITLGTGEGSRFPPDSFRLVCPSGEIIFVRSRSGDVLSWTLGDRGAEGTMPSSIGNGATVKHELTAQSLKEVSDYARSAVRGGHNWTDHTGDIFPSGNQQLAGDLDGDSADTRSIGASARLLVVSGKTIRTENVGSATPTGGSSGDLKTGTDKIWFKDGATWKSIAVGGGGGAPATWVPTGYDVEVWAGDSTYTAIDGRTGSTVATETSYTKARAKAVNYLSRRTYPGGKIATKSIKSDNAVISVDTTMHNCPGMTEWMTGRGKRSTSTNGREVGVILQAATGFTDAPWLSWLNPVAFQPPRTAPTLGAATSGGSVTIGTHYVAYTWVDYAGNESPLSPAASITIVIGANKTIPVTLPAFPAWAASANIYITPAGRAWTGTTAMTTADIVIPTAPNLYAYRCTGAGTTGGSEPTWPLASGGTVVDGGVTWTRVGFDYGRRISGTAKNMEFWRVGTAIATTSTTVTTADTAAGFQWAGVPYYRTEKVLYDKEGPFDVLNPAQYTTWAVNTVYVANSPADKGIIGSVVKPSTPNGHLYRCIAATGDKKSGGSAPAWTTGTNSVVVDNHVTWMETGSDSGGVTNGAHLIYVTAVIGGVEQVLCPISSITAAGSLPITMQLPDGPSTTTSRKIYLTAAGDTGPTATFKLAATVSDNTTFATSVSTVDGSLGASVTFDDKFLYLLSGHYEDSVLNECTLDCNGNGAGTQGADTGILASSTGGGNSGHLHGVKVIGHNVTGVRVGYSGEERGSSDIRFEGVTIGPNKGSTGNVNAHIQVNAGDSSFVNFNAASMTGNGVCAGMHIRAGSANVRIAGPDTHIGGGGGGVCDVWVDSCNSLWIGVELYLDNVTFPMGAIWLRPYSNTSIGRLNVMNLIINTNADVPWVTFDGGKGCGAGVTGNTGGFLITMVQIQGMNMPGQVGGATQPGFKAINGYQNSGISVDKIMGFNVRKDVLWDNAENSNTVQCDMEGQYFLSTTGGNSYANTLSEQEFAFVGAAGTSTAWHIPHNCRAAPKVVHLTPMNAAAAGAMANITSVTKSATEIVVNLSVNATNPAWDVRLKAMN